MSELSSRLRTAWFALRGWSVIKGVEIRHGEIDVPGNLAIIGRGTAVESNEIRTRGPVIFTSHNGGVAVGNEGDVLAQPPPTGA